ncbi:MAG: CheR family methyltransferase [Thermoanaerobaculia bacterium]|nr:CheR family methyltransferase [Thermoanaerobaculia bacterium]
MTDGDCTEFLKWALPRMGMRWEGFRKPRGQVCKRIRERLGDLELRSFERYRDYLDDHPEEWEELTFRCRVTISRFFRERSVWRDLGRRIGDLWEEKDGTDPLAVWSSGCASGEEPWSLRILWDLQIACDLPEEASLEILATDFDPHLLDRARRACYPQSSLEEVPERWRETAFERREDEHCLQGRFRHGVEWRRHDLRREAPPGLFDLVFCRYVVYIYSDEAAQEKLTRRLAGSIRPGGLLVVGAKEEIPEPCEDLFEPFDPSIYRRAVLD